MSAAAIPFVVEESALQPLEQEASTAGQTRLDALVALAWHLRQRDGRRAVQLAQQARAAMAQGAGAEARTAVVASPVVGRGRSALGARRV